MNKFRAPQKSKNEMVMQCWNCSQRMSFVVELYDDRFVHALKQSDSFHEAETAKLREVIDSLKEQINKTRTEPAHSYHPISEF